MFYDAGKQAAALHYGLGAIGGGIGAVALQMLLDRDMRTELLQEPNPKIHPQIIADAAKIAPLLKHLDPGKARIGIGGLPGTGKSEMASELGKHLGMQHHDADVSLGHGVPPGHITDRYDTLVNEDPEQFDALLHMKRPGATRGPLTEALMNLPALDKATTKQFSAAKGKVSTPTATTQLKLKPPGGFGTKAKDQSFINKGEVAKKVAPGLLGMVAGTIAVHLLRK